MIKDLIIKNRSYRKYDERAEISKELIKELINNVRFVPSAHNLQPIRYYISTKREVNAEIFSILKWAAYLPDWDGPSEGERPSAYVIILADKKLNYNKEIIWCDIGIACQTILLQAVERGFGGCIIGNFNDILLSKIINVGNDYQPMLVLALGKPKESIILEETNSDKSIKYYRDNYGNHHVPKRKMEDILLNCMDD